jgi:hypothetical protein
MTIIDKACWERGCPCHDIGDEGVELEVVAIANEGMGGIEWLVPHLPDDTVLYAVISKENT